jgi:hypothetical protein
MASRWGSWMEQTKRDVEMLLLLLLKGKRVAVVAKGGKCSDVKNKLKGAHSHLATRNSRGSSLPFEVDVKAGGQAQ